MKKKVESKSIATRKSTETPVSIDGVLIGWPNIAKYLGQPMSVAQRWARSGMPVERKGRAMTAQPGELTRWLGRESRKEAVHISQAADEDMLRELRRALREVHSEKKK